MGREKRIHRCKMKTLLTIISASLLAASVHAQTDAWKFPCPTNEFVRSRLKSFNGVGFTNHPRGGRLGQFEWSFPGMKTAVHLDGTVNDDSDTDRGWTVELAFPWKGLKWLATDGRALPPKDGDVW